MLLFQKGWGEISLDEQLAVCLFLPSYRVAIIARRYVQLANNGRDSPSFCPCPSTCCGTAITCAATVAKQTDHGANEGYSYEKYSKAGSVEGFASGHKVKASADINWHPVIIIVGSVQGVCSRPVIATIICLYYCIALSVSRLKGKLRETEALKIIPGTWFLKLSQ